LDRKDYYRLKWGVDEAIDQPKEQGLTTVLFEYDGKSLALVDNEAVSIVLAPKRVTAIQTLLGLRPPEEAAALKERWLSETIVRWNFLPAVRPAPNWDDFKWPLPSMAAATGSRSSVARRTRAVNGG
jgi:hypothetical protein